MSKKRLIVNVLYTIFIVLIITFIFGNSLSNKEESANQSGSVLAFVNSILEFINFPVLMSHKFLRKLAHFTEFFVLGASVMGLFLYNKKENYDYFVYSCFFCCFIAMTDETIQYFTNRGSMLLDVWLDFFGACVGITFLYFIYKFIKSKKSKR